MHIKRSLVFEATFLLHLLEKQEERTKIERQTDGKRDRLDRSTGKQRQTEIKKERLKK